MSICVCPVERQIFERPGGLDNSRVDSLSETFLRVRQQFLFPRWGLKIYDDLNLFLLLAMLEGLTKLNCLRIGFECLIACHIL